MCLTSLNRFVNKNKDSVIVPEELLVKSTLIVHLSVYIQCTCNLYCLLYHITFSVPKEKCDDRPVKTDPSQPEPPMPTSCPAHQKKPCDIPGTTTFKLTKMALIV